MQSIETRPELPARFWSKISPDGECWIWNAAKFRDGYGMYQVNRKAMRVHRYVYRMLVGSIPDGMLVCHSCDRPACVNPAHLFLGTPAMNSSDMVRKGRQASGARNARALYPERTARGERAGLSKLRTEQVLEIRARLAQGMTRRLIALQFGVSTPAIDGIAQRRTWKHIP